MILVNKRVKLALLMPITIFAKPLNSSITFSCQIYNRGKRQAEAECLFLNPLQARHVQNHVPICLCFCLPPWLSGVGETGSSSMIRLLRLSANLLGGHAESPEPSSHFQVLIPGDWRECQFGIHEEEPGGTELQERETGGPASEPLACSSCAAHWAQGFTDISQVIPLQTL